MPSQLERLDPEARAIVIAAAIANIKRRQTQLPEWRLSARPEQLPPEQWIAGDDRVWYLRGGRGGGKTWAGANTLAEFIRALPVGEYGVVAPTYADARDTCIEGPSGLLAALGTNRVEVDRGASTLVASWNRSLHDLRLRNGSVVWADGADDGAPTIQGKNLRVLWAEEVGLWKKQWRMAWDESIRFAVRIPPAKILATGTPKRGNGLVKELMADADVVKSVVKTEDNIANLDPGLVRELMSKYAGTTLGRQELFGEVLDDSEHALLKRSHIRTIAPQMMMEAGALRPAMARRVVAVDPAVTNEADSDETGIIGAGIGLTPDPLGRTMGWVLADRSMKGTPREWAEAAVRLYHDLRADRIVAEANQGGEMVEHTIHTVDANVPITLVHASKGKQARAEPVAALYEQGRIAHAEDFPELEDQWCNWEPTDGSRSPDRLDACVWAFTDLMLEDKWAAYRR